MLARFFARMLIAPLGLACAVFAAFAMLAAISARHLGDMGLLPAEVMILGHDFSFDAVTIAVLFAPLMGAPAMVSVLLSEMFSIRSWIYHAVAGAVSALLPWSLAPAAFEGPAFTSTQILAVGIVGGLAHWLVAGRRAGLADVRAQPPLPEK